MQHRQRTRTLHRQRMRTLHRPKTRMQHRRRMRTVTLPKTAMQPPKTIMVLLQTMLRAKTSPSKLHRNPNAKSRKQKQKRKPRLSPKDMVMRIIMRTPRYRCLHRLRRPRGYVHGSVRQPRARSLPNNHLQAMMRMTTATPLHLQRQSRTRTRRQRTGITPIPLLHRLLLRRRPNTMRMTQKSLIHIKPQMLLMYTTPMLRQLYQPTSNLLSVNA